MQARRNPHRRQPSGARAVLHLVTTLWAIACGAVILARATVARASWFFWLVGAVFLALGVARAAEAVRAARSTDTAPGVPREDSRRGGNRP